MAVFFVQQRGTVVLLNKGGDLPFAIKLGDTGVGGAFNPGSSAIITQAAIVQNSGYQFMHTLSNTIYSYVFGDRIGELKVSGLAFSNFCGGEINGIQQVLDAYKDYRIANQQKPILVSLANRAFRALLTGSSVDIVDPETQLGQWTLQFAALPGNA